MIVSELLDGTADRDILALSPERLRRPGGPPEADRGGLAGQSAGAGA